MAVIRRKRIGVAEQRSKRVRAKLSNARPRLSVHRSNRAFSAQIIDDVNGKTLAAATSLTKNVTGKEAAILVGREIAEKAKSAGIADVVFDRGSYSFEGNIKELADAARAGGLNF